MCVLVPAHLPRNLSCRRKSRPQRKGHKDTTHSLAGPDGLVTTLQLEGCCKAAGTYACLHVLHKKLLGGCVSTRTSLRKDGEQIEEFMRSCKHACATSIALTSDLLHILPTYPLPGSTNCFSKIKPGLLPRPSPGLFDAPLAELAKMIGLLFGIFRPCWQLSQWCTINARPNNGGGTLLNSPPGPGPQWACRRGDFPRRAVACGGWGRSRLASAPQSCHSRHARLSPGPNNQEPAAKAEHFGPLWARVCRHKKQMQNEQNRSCKNPAFSFFRSCPWPEEGTARADGNKSAQRVLFSSRYH